MSKETTAHGRVSCGSTEINHVKDPMEVPNAAVANFDSLKRLAETVVDSICFDNVNGDVKLIVRNSAGENVAFIVSSAAMIRACRPWNRILAGPFAGAQPDHPKILDFREDDYDALKILMDIIHFQFTQVPTSLTLTGLHQMAVITDRYFATALVAPWIHRWVEAIEHTIDGPSAPLWLWIAWEYGLLDKFDRVSQALYMDLALKCRAPVSDVSCGTSVHVNHSECGTWNGHVLFASESYPDDIWDTIKIARTNTIHLLLDPVYEYLTKLFVAANSYILEENNTTRKLCRLLRRDCLRLQIGSLIASLIPLGLWPQKDASEITMSLRSLSEALLGINLSDCCSNEFSPGTAELYQRKRKRAVSDISSTGRATCGGFSEVIGKIQKVRDDDYSVITTKHRHYMMKQRKQWDGDWTEE